MNLNNETLVTVIIPVFNRSHLIQETLDSVICQTYKNIEILVIDDGSTDDLIGVLQPYIDENRIRYIKQQNKGVSAARNNGVSLARGELIAFLDSDDLYYENMVRELVRYFSKHPDIHFAHTNFEKFDSETRKGLGVRDTSYFQGNIYPELLLYWKSLIPPSCVMFRKEIIKKVGVFNEIISHGEDLEYWARIAKNFTIGHVPKVLVAVRVHLGNVSAVRLSTSNSFRFYLDQVFKNDPNLTTKFKYRALSNMYLNTGLMLLSSPISGADRQARKDFSKAIRHYPLTITAYLGFLVSLLPHKIRIMLYDFLKKPKSVGNG